MNILLILSIYITVHNHVVLQTDSARILCAIPSPAISHQYVFRPFTNELAKRGHELVIITTDPVLPKERPSDNVTEIDIGFSYEDLKELYKTLEKKSLTLKKGVVFDEEIWCSDVFLLWQKIYIKQFKYEAIRKVIDDRNQHFDLIVVESMAESYLILAYFFNAPVISFSTLYGTPQNYETVGAISQHPRLYPNYYRTHFDSSTLWNEVRNLYYDLILKNSQDKVVEQLNELLKDEFGPKTPKIQDLRDKVDMLFVNSHPIYDRNRPVPPGVIYLGALHLQPAKEIPQDLKAYLDNSKRGVIYLSLGTNVRSDLMDKELLDAIVKAIGSIPYDVLWKFDAELLETKPDNVEIRKWFPQRDLLMHPNVKLFITQGGLQSTDETIDAAVPIVCIPFLGDQFYNCHQSAELGIGLDLDPRVMSSDDIIHAITTVIENESYKRNVHYLRSVIRDQPQTPLERAIWWTEYVIRHGGARHLRSPAANISWSEYLMLDVIVPVVISVFLMFILLVVIISSILYPNIKLFVTQGVLQSTDETIDAGVPIVCISFLADQFYNCHQSAKLGIGLELDPRTMKSDDIIHAITTVIGNKSFKQNIEKLRNIMLDQPQTPLERAIWWTEYVIRHGGARHLRSPAANISWSEYLMLDVIVPVVIIVFFIFSY